MNEQATKCRQIAPESDRVDLAAPAFSAPTNVSNPLHPTASTPSILMLGSVNGLPFRTEVTLLPETKPKLGRFGPGPNSSPPGPGWDWPLPTRSPGAMAAGSR